MEQAAIGIGAPVMRPDHEAVLLDVEQKILVAGLVSKGDHIAITIGDPIGKAGGTNWLKLVKIGEA